MLKSQKKKNCHLNIKKAGAFCYLPVIGKKLIVFNLYSMFFFLLTMIMNCFQMI